MPKQTRDLQQTQQARLDEKRDKGQVVRAVLVEINGSIWANQSERRVWYLPQGATQPGQVLCIRDVRPQADLPVLVGKAEGSDILEVLSVDPFVMVNNPNLPPQIIDHHKSHEPGGRDVMNLYPKQIVPFQVFYAGSGFLVNVVSGQCEIDGVAVKFKGKLNFDLASEQPGSGFVNLVGLYVNSAGTLGIETGATVADTITNIPEPAWPPSAIRLCMIKLNGDQTSIAYTDIIYHNSLYTTARLDFPVSGRILLNGVEYNDFTLANTDAATGDFLLFGYGTFPIVGLSTLKAATYKGQGPDATFLTITVPATTTGNAFTLPDGCVIEDMSIDFQATDISQALAVNGAYTITMQNVRITADQTASGSVGGLYVLNGATANLRDVEIVIDAAASRAEAIRVLSSTLTAWNCSISGISSAGYSAGGVPNGIDVYVYDGTAVVNLYDCLLVHNTLIRRNDFGPANIVHGWAPEPPPEYNPIINGGLNVWQRGTSFPAAGVNAYTADMWQYLNTTDAVHTVSRSTDVPTVAQAGRLVNYSLLIDCTTPDSSITFAQGAAISYRMEGYDWAKLAQAGFWLSFWIKATKTGVYCVSVKNSGSDRSYIAEYTVFTTATWEYKEIYVPASPSAGTWDYTTGVGVWMRWILAAGPSVQTTANTWQTGSYASTSAQVNATDSTANDWRIWGIKMSKYRSPFTAPSYQAELARAQRYYWQSSAGIDILAYGYAYSTTQARMTVPTPVEMRAVPTITASEWGTLRGNGAGPGITAVSPSYVMPQGIFIDVTVATGLTVNETYVAIGKAPAVTFDASL